jgi:cell division protein FtsI/penicillin-binding protein 2
VTRAVPLVLIAGLAFVAGVTIGDRNPGLDAAQRFLDAWRAGDYEAMYLELTPAAASDHPLEEFTEAYEEAAAVATLVELRPGEPQGPEREGGRDVVTAPVALDTHVFQTLAATVSIPVLGPAIAWEPNLAFPGLRPGEELERRTRAPERAPLLARDGTPLAEGPASARGSPLGAVAADITGTIGVAIEERAARLEELGFPPGTLIGANGLEQAFDERLLGTPGGVLIAVAPNGEARELARGKPRQGKPVRTTIDPALQSAAVAALGGRFGGVAVLDARSGDVRALAGIAYSAPQPPGSIFKVITTVAALEEGAVSLDDEFPVTSSAAVGGREITNANEELCGGTFVESFAHSCNSVFAPLGAELGGRKLVEVSERFGFNALPALFNSEATEAIEPPESTIPEHLESDLDVGVSAIGQGQVLATPLQMASVAQTIARGGTRMPTAMATEPALRPAAEPIRVTDRKIARTIRDLMVEVVTDGTGVAAALPDVQVAGKTGTAELGPDPDVSVPPGEPVPQEVDAWFIAFAPAEKPRLAVGVMIVDADGSGGEVAAPIARDVLAAGLEE